MAYRPVEKLNINNLIKVLVVAVVSIVVPGIYLTSPVEFNKNALRGEVLTTKTTEPVDSSPIAPVNPFKSASSSATQNSVKKNTSGEIHSTPSRATRSSVGSVWETLLQQNFSQRNVSEILEEFESLGGGRVFHNEIIDYLNSNYRNVDNTITLPLFKMVSYSYEWPKSRPGKDTSPKDLRISEFIRQQISDPISTDVLKSALMQSYKVAAGNDRYVLVENALEEHGHLLTKSDAFKAKLRAAQYNPSLLADVIRESSHHTQQTKDEIYRLSYTDTDLTDSRVRNSVNEFLEKNKVEFNADSDGLSESGAEAKEDKALFNNDELSNNQESIQIDHERVDEDIKHFNSWFRMKIAVENIANDNSFSEFVNSYIVNSNSVSERIAALNYGFSESKAGRIFHKFSFIPTQDVEDTLIHDYERISNKRIRKDLKNILENKFSLIVD